MECIERYWFDVYWGFCWSRFDVFATSEQIMIFPLSSFVGEPSQSMGKSFIKSYAASVWEHYHIFKGESVVYGLCNQVGMVQQR